MAGYEVNQGVDVKVRNIESVGTILGGIGGLGASNISGLNFSIDDEDELKKEANELAINDAKEKAEILADNLGVKLVRIINFSESGYFRYIGRNLARKPCPWMALAVLRQKFQQVKTKSSLKSILSTR